MKVSRRHAEWWKILEFLVLLQALPVLAFYFAAKTWGSSVLAVSYYAIVTLFVIQAALLYLQSLAGVTRKPFAEPG